MTEQDISGHRDAARKYVIDGCAGFARAFNFLDDGRVPWRTSSQTQAKLKTLCADIVQLFNHCELTDNPEHAMHLRAQAARADPAIEKLIRRASKKTPIRAK